MGKLTFGSLFAGIGGLDLGLERAGFECRWQVEIDDYANQVLKKHWPDVPRFRDVKTFPPTEGVDAVDLICGGFPCQDISYAGKGAGLDGERSGLFYELIRVVREVGPRYILLENVSALLTRGLDQVLGTLASIGFDAEWHCIPAAAVGAPHIRDRVFILAYSTSKRHRKGRESEDIPETDGRQDRQVRAKSSSTSKQSKDMADSNIQRPQGMREERENTQRKDTDRYIRPGGMAIRNRTGESKPWEPEPAVGRVANGVPSRVDRLRGLGNAVVPQVAEYIGRQIINSLNQ